MRRFCQLSKNICSVRQRPMPSAPNFAAFLASVGVSALVRTLRVLYLSAQSMILPKLPAMEASTVGMCPHRCYRWSRRWKCSRPRGRYSACKLNYLFSSSISISAQPDTQQVPIPRATTAAWEVIPPRTVRIPSEAFIPSMSSGEVSRRTRTTFSPLSFPALHPLR